MLGLHATPVTFRPSQRPLAAIRLRQAPKSIVAFRYRARFVVDRVWLDLGRLRVFVVGSL
jgi:hypothetical protein